MDIREADPRDVRRDAERQSALLSQLPLGERSPQTLGEARYPQPSTFIEQLEQTGYRPDGSVAGGSFVAGSGPRFVSV